MIKLNHFFFDKLVNLNSLKLKNLNLSHTIVFNPNVTTQTKNLNNMLNNQNISLDNLLKNFDTSSALFKDNSGFQVNDYGSFEDNSGSFE